MISIGLTVVAAMHLTAVYVAMMGPLVGLWLQWKARRDEVAADLDRWLLRVAVGALVAAAILGGTALALIAYSFPQAYLAAARVLPRSRFWPYGVVELLFSLVCFIFAAVLPTRTRAAHPNPVTLPEEEDESVTVVRHGRDGEGGIDKTSRFYLMARWLVTACGCLNLTYHFPTLFVMLGVLSVRPASWGQRLKFTSLLGDSEILARLAHHLLAALVVTGMVMAWYGVRRGGAAAKTIVWGARISVAALLCQLFSGLWLVVMMPVGSRQALLGEDVVAGLLFAGSLLGTFLVLPRLAAAALGHTERRATMITILLVLTIVALMTATRHRTRALVIPQARNSASQDRTATPMTPRFAGRPQTSVLRDAMPGQNLLF